MYKIFLLILMCKRVITEDEGSNAKYIDLLPEEEKQEFLNRIARRILEGIKSNDTPNESHAEITDDQLDTQDAFVQEILKEETDNLKNKKTNHDTQEISENDRVESNNGNVNEDNEDRSNFNNKAEHIDLTLREGRRQKRLNSDSENDAESTTGIPYDIVPVKIVYDEFENENVKTSNKSSLTLESDHEENTDKETYVSTSTTSSDLIFTTNNLNTEFLNSSDKEENVVKFFHNNVQFGTEIKDLEPDLSEKYTTQNNDINEENTTPFPTIVSGELTGNKTHQDVTWGAMKNINESDSREKVEEHNIEEPTTMHNIINNEDFQTEYIKISTSSNEFAETIKNVESTIATTINVSDSVSQSHEPIGKYLRSMTESHEYKDVKTDRSPTDTVTIKDLDNIETPSEDTSTSETVTFDNPLSRITTHYQIQNKESFGITKSAPANILTTSENPAGLSNLENNTVRMNTREKPKTILRARDISDVSQIDENDYAQNLDEDSNKLKVYEVYEVDAKQPHFISAGEVKQNNHPLYVPIYNYAPENAYFRPYNKLGPNVEEIQYQDGLKSTTVIDSYQINYLNTRNRFSGYNNNKNRVILQKTIRNPEQPYKKQNAKQYEFIKPVTQNLLNQEIFYNPYDYADSDYYFGRILRRGKKIYNSIYKSGNKKNTAHHKIFPDSNEKDHPSSRIHNSDTIKDHVRAIRQILYNQKIFGYVPRATESIGRKANQYLHNDTTSKTQEHSNIAIDYYFGRADPNENDEINQEFRLKEPKLKIVPITLNQLGFNPENKPEKLRLQMDSSESKLSSKTQSINQRMSELPFEKLFRPMLDVLKDLIKEENNKLVQYDWLKTTVNIQAAIRKLMDLIEELKHGEQIHPKDIELIKYTIYIFKTSRIALDKEAVNTDSNEIKSNAPRAKKRVMKFPKIKERKIEEPIKRWKNYAALLLRNDKGLEVDSFKEQNVELFDDLEDMLQDLLFNLNDLHDAIQHISAVTEYKNQNWFKDLKAIYLEKGSEKSLAQLVLHLSLSRLLDLIEESANHGVEEDFRSYIKKNREFVTKCKKECVFVLNVLEEIRKINAKNS